MTRRFRFHKAITVLFLVLLLLTGCWGRREPDRLAIILTAAVDRDGGGDFEWTVEISDPLKSGGGGGSATGGGGGVGRSPGVIVKGKGRSLLEGRVEVDRSIHREILWSHTDYIIIGENFARTGLQPLLDDVTRFYELRRNARIFVSSGNAGELLEGLHPPFNDSVSSALRDLTQRPSETMAPRETLTDFMRRLYNEGQDPYLPVMGASKTAFPDPVLEGMAVFHEDQLVSILDHDLTLGVMWMLGEPFEEDLTWPCPGGASDGYMGVTIVRSSARLRTWFEGGKPQAKLTATAEGDVQEWQCPQRLDETLLIAADAMGAATIKGQIEDSLTALRKVQSDPVGFGSSLHRADPAEWAKLRTRWYDEYASMPVSIEVRVGLRRIGFPQETPPSRSVEVDRPVQGETAASRSLRTANR